MCAQCVAYLQHSYCMCMCVFLGVQITHEHLKQVTVCSNFKENLEPVHLCVASHCLQACSGRQLRWNLAAAQH